MRQEKRKMILDTARDVFGEKGYSTVKMSDIVEACQISRGGLYLYFSSIEELFQEVIIEQSKQKFSIITKMTEENQPFHTILFLYFDLQKKRLLNIDDMILVATYEYYTCHQEPKQQIFQKNYVAYLKKNIQDLLALGVKQGEITNTNLEELADMFVLLIEGMSIFKTFNQLTEPQIDAQIDLLKKTLQFT